MDKSLLRQNMILQRRALSKNDKVLFDIAIYKRVMPYLEKGKTIGIYVSTFDEVDTISIIEELLAMNIKVCVPKVNGLSMDHILINSLSELKIGAFNILEPVNKTIVSKDDIDIIVVPLLAFDHHLYRIGYGKGYYDRYLANYKGITIGLAYDFYKIADTLPDEHDISLDYIITSNNEYVKL